MEASAHSSWHYGGFVSPFDLAIGFQVLGFWLITALWEENYGTPASSQGGAAHAQHADFVGQIRSGVTAIAQSAQLSIIMAMVACFEGSMYTFVFNWTPALESSFSTPAFGMVFAAFMMAFMCGSSTFDLLRVRGVGVM